MVIRLRTNIPALIGLRNLRNITADYATTLERLTSGLRINRAGDDPAGLVISNKFKVMIKGIQTATTNAQEGYSLVQLTDGALGDIVDILQEIRALAVQSANDTNTSLDRNTLNNQVQELLEEIDRVASNTDFNDIKLLNGNLVNSLSFLVGANKGDIIRFGMEDTRTEAIGVANISVSTAAAASLAINDVDEALSLVEARQGVTGVVQNRLTYAINFLSDMELYYDTARSYIEDADIAEEVVNYSLLQVLSNTATAYLAQANLFPGNVMNLLVFQSGG
ncbi:MAG: flagellin [Candidatus Hydrogenedentota bacterium]